MLIDFFSTKYKEFYFLAQTVDLMNEHTYIMSENYDEYIE